VAVLRHAPALLLSAALLGPFGCADAPIESADLRPDGQLRPTVYRQAGFARAGAAVLEKRPVTLSAVLAAEADGRLSDTTTFDAGVGAVHLHLRADGLDAPRTVVFRWTNLDTGTQVETLGVLSPEPVLRRVASLFLGPSDRGRYRVEVLGLPVEGEPPPVLFFREFEVRASDPAP